MKRTLTFLFVNVLFVSCWNQEINSGPDESIPFNGTGYVPVYASEEEIRKIEVLPARNLHEPGKIYRLGSYLFVNELGKGVHMINNVNPRKPVNEGFISIPGNYDIAAKGNFLYADNLSDLVVLEISDPKNIRVVKRIENTVDYAMFPRESNVFFECPDSKKGKILRWEKVAMEFAPKCRR